MQIVYASWSSTYEVVPVVDQKAVEEVEDEKPSLESVASTIPVQDEPVTETTEDVITKDEPTSVDAESKDESVPEKVEAAAFAGTEGLAPGAFLVDLIPISKSLEASIYITV